MNPQQLLVSYSWHIWHQHSYKVLLVRSYHLSIFLLTISLEMRLISGAEQPNKGIISPSLQGYTNFLNTMQSASIPSAVVPFEQTTLAGILYTFMSLGRSPSLEPKLRHTVIFCNLHKLNPIKPRGGGESAPTSENTKISP